MEEHCLVGNGKLESVDYKDSKILSAISLQIWCFTTFVFVFLIGSSYQLGQVIPGTYNCLCLLTGSYFIHFFAHPHRIIGQDRLTTSCGLPRPILERFICAHGLLT